MRANETADRGLISTKWPMTSLTSSSISIIGRGMSDRRKMDVAELSGAGIYISLISQVDHALVVPSSSRPKARAIIK